MNNLLFHIIIPARYASTRLPVKLLKPLAGKPLLQHTYERACAAGAQTVTIATDHSEIKNKMEALGATVIMTCDQHLTGSDRLAEAVDILNWPDEAIVVNVQGDEPLIPASLIQQVANNLAQKEKASIATLYEDLTDPAQLFDPNIVKVVTNHEGLACYFSRAPIPWNRDEFSTLPCSAQSPLPKNTFKRHIGLYAYRARFLRAYRTQTPDVSEQLEKLEQLRALHYGFNIHVARGVTPCPPGVDTPEDFNRMVYLLE